MVAKCIEWIYLVGMPRADEMSNPRRPSRAGRGGALLELALLGVLADGPRHGYDLKKHLDGLPGGSGVSFGSLYPTLNRLADAGDVTTSDASATGPAPDTSPGTTPGTTPGNAPGTTGALSGDLATHRSERGARRATTSRRSRKVYAITAGGLARLHELLDDLDPADDRTFTLQVAFARHLDQPARLALLAKRRSEVARRIDNATTPGAPGAPLRIADRFERALRRHTAAQLGAELDWIDELLAAESPPGDGDHLAPTLAPPLATPATTTAATP